MKFYTNVKQYGDNILYIGYDNGVRVEEKIKFEPTLFIGLDEQTIPPMPKQSYNGQPVRPVDFDSIKKAKDYIKQYAGMAGRTIFGTDRFANEYIAKMFPEKDIEYQMSLLRIFNLDIEVFSGNGFPDPYLALEKITACTIFDSKTSKFHVW